MPTAYNMPTLGQSMEEGTVVQWFKKVGEPVHKGEKLVEIMSDKANFEVESEIDGVLLQIVVDADGFAPVNTPIAWFGAAGEVVGASEGTTGTQGTIGTAGTKVTAVGTDEPFFASPRARKAAEELGVDIAALSDRGTGVDGRIVERDVLAWVAEQKTSAPERVRATPLATRIADDLGIDLSDLAAGLPGSRVRSEHVRSSVSPASLESPRSIESLKVTQLIPFRGLRKIIADNVTKSRQTAPHVTLTVEVDMTRIMELLPELRVEVQRASNTKLTISDIIIKAAARGLTNHPLCNAALIGNEIRVYSDRNVGVAVATDTGLVVPVIKSADSKSLGEISVELKALVERCRTGKQTADDIADGTFTITNLGSFGIVHFDPIIVPPQSCILGVCSIVDKPVARSGAVVVRSMMNLCLSFDHRVLDGAPAAQYLQRLKELLESPLSIFV